MRDFSSSFAIISQNLHLNNRHSVIMFYTFNCVFSGFIARYHFFYSFDMGNYKKMGRTIQWRMTKSILPVNVTEKLN